MFQEKSNLNIITTIILCIVVTISNVFNTRAETITVLNTSTFNQNKDSLFIKYNNARSKYNQKKYYEALREGLNILEESNKVNNYELIMLSNYLLGEVSEKTNNEEKALNYFKNSLNVYEEFYFNNKEVKKENNQYSYIENLLKIGGTFHKLGDIDNAKTYYDRIIKVNSFGKKASSTKAKAYINLAVININSSELDSAKKYILEAIEIHKQNNDRIQEAAALGNLASIYLKEKNYAKAKATYSKGLKLIEKDKSSNAVNFKRSLYYNLAWTLYLLKDYKAYDYQEKSYEIKDSLRDSEINRIVEEIYTQHELNLEKEKTALVKEQRKLEEAQEAKTSILFGVLSFLVLIVSGVIIYNYKLRQKNLRLKLSESKLIQQQNLEKVRSEAQVKILNATIDGKETERKLIAEILHDNVSALLSSANMHLTATKKQFNGNTPQEIEKTQAIISEASQKVRDLSHNLVSSILLKFGLEYAIKDVVKKYSNSQLKLEVSAKNINRYNQEFEIKIFNVIQELINNILKHSKAKHAQIDLKEEKNQLTVLVKDDGVGFSTSSSSFSDGIGLNQVEARIHMMNGKLTIKSEVNVGTSIHIAVPILKKEKNFSKLTSVS